LPGSLPTDRAWCRPSAARRNSCSAITLRLLFATQTKRTFTPTGLLGVLPTGRQRRLPQQQLAAVDVPLIVRRDAQRHGYVADNGESGYIDRTA
jgi:hypothetical protein